MNRTRHQAAAILRHFEEAVRSDEMRGTLHPDDRDDIHDWYKRAYARMVQHLMGGDQ